MILMRRGVAPLLTALVLTSTSAALAGCSAFTEDTVARDGGVRAATAFYPLQFVTERVAGEHAEVTNLTVPGREPHDLGLTIKETAEIAQADLVVYQRDFQPAVDDAVETSAKGAVLDAADVVDLVANDDQGDLDPHFWQDPLRMALLGDAVADALAEVDPDHAADFAANALDLRADLEGLDAAYAEGLRGCERKTVVVSHDAFGYLTKYGLHFEAIAGLSPDAEPTPADLGRLQRLIEEDGITTVFGERLAPPDLVDTLARDAGVATAVLDPAEGLTDQTEGEDYLSLMQANLGSLREANGCP